MGARPDVGRRNAITLGYHLRVKLNALQALLAAVEDGSLRAASRRLGVSQPALTKLMRELELELGAPVLQRSTAGVFPSAQGKVLVDHARRALRELDEARAQIRQLGGQMVGQLSVAAMPVAVLDLMPATLRSFSQEYPDIQVRLREELFIAQLLTLREGAVDVAIGAVPDNLPAGEFELEPLMPTSMVVVTGPHSSLASTRSLRQLQQARWIYASPINESSYAHQLFEQHGLRPPAPAAMASSTLAQLALISQGDYVCLLPESMAYHPTSAPFVRVLPLEEGPLQLQLCAVTRRSTMLKPALRHFIAHLHRVAQHTLRTRGAAGAMAADQYGRPT